MKLKEDLKTELDALCAKYETKEFIKDDPVQFIHLFNKKEDIESAGFIAALFAFGRREVFIKKLFELFNFMQMRPYEFILNFNPKMGLNGINYRFIKEEDLIFFFSALNKIYKKDKITLEELFLNSWKTKKEVFSCLQGVCDYFYNSGLIPKTSAGCKFMLSNPKNKGAMKRMNMFLRWMIRKNSPVDLGIWDFMPQSSLLIPLDTHVGNISRSLTLIKRKQNDFKTVIELTSKLKEFDEKDPVKYDFALFGYGVNKENQG